MNVLPSVYLSTLRKKLAPLLIDSKLYTSGSIANSQGMLPEINESSAIGKTRV